MPFKSEVYFPQSYRAPEIKPHLPSKPDLQGFAFTVQNLQAGEPNMGLRTLTLHIIILRFVGCPPESIALDYIRSLSLLPISLWPLHCVFSCISFLGGFALFH